MHIKDFSNIERVQGDWCSKDRTVFLRVTREEVILRENTKDVIKESTNLKYIELSDDDCNFVCLSENIDIKQIYPDGDIRIKLKDGRDCDLGRN